MDSLLLGISRENLYLKNNKIIPLSTIHKPYFLAFSDSLSQTKKNSKKIIDIWEKNTDENQPS